MRSLLEGLQRGMVCLPLLCFQVMRFNSPQAQIQRRLTLTGTTFSLYNLINLATEKKSRLINIYWLLSHGSVI